MHFLQNVLRWEPNSRPTIVDLCKSQWLGPWCLFFQTRKESTSCRRAAFDALYEKNFQRPRAASPRVCPTGPRAESPRVCPTGLQPSSQSLARISTLTTIELGEPFAVFDMSDLPRPPPKPCTILGRKLCQCGRRCRNPGHSPSGPGCQSKELVKGSALCVCSAFVSSSRCV